MLTAAESRQVSLGPVVNQVVRDEPQSTQQIAYRGQLSATLPLL